MPFAIAMRPLLREDLADAVGVVARGMQDNPVNIRIMGDDEARRRRRLAAMFAIALPRLVRKGTLLGAFANGTLVGVLGMTRSGHCRTTTLEKALMAPRLLAAIGPSALLRTADWQSNWEAHDPQEAHWHLGPVAADAHLRGRGVGSTMMKAYCLLLDREGACGYLETDKAENLAFYARFGFEVVGEAFVLGIRNWFMHRPKRRGHDA